jgi:uncharacterized protein GlcG (DUF336 family)
VLFSTENELAMLGLLTQRNLSFDLAFEAATAALETARSRGYHVGVAVADRSGQLLVLLRDDGGGAHLLDGARRKAFTAVSAHNRTSVLSKAVDARSGEPDPHLVFLEGVLMVGGGVPIKASDEIVGAIGVSGSPGSVHDEECAEAGISKIAASLN